MFCTACGAKHPESVNFCGECGAPMSGAPAAAAPSPAQQPSAVEPVLGVSSKWQRKTGFMKQTLYDVIVTPRRLVFAQVTDAMVAAAVPVARARAQSEGKGLLARAFSGMNAWAVVAEGHAAMTPDQAAAETPGNFAIPLEQIVGVRIRSGSSRSDDERSKSDPDRITVQTASGPYEFTLPTGDAAAARQILVTVLGQRVA